jgi:hypothetical protein
VKILQLFKSYFLEMSQKLTTVKYYVGWDFDWDSTRPCKCKSATHQARLLRFDPAYYSLHYASRNVDNAQRCQDPVEMNADGVARLEVKT